MVVYKGIVLLLKTVWYTLLVVLFVLRIPLFILGLFASLGGGKGGRCSRCVRLIFILALVVTAAVLISKNFDVIRDKVQNVRRQRTNTPTTAETHGEI